MQRAKRFHNPWADRDGERAWTCQAKGVNLCSAHVSPTATTRWPALGLPFPVPRESSTAHERKGINLGGGEHAVAQALDPRQKGQA